MGQQWERIQSLERELALAELNAPGSSSVSETPEPAVADLRDHNREARLILGVSESASFDEVRKAYLKLVERSQPNRFVPGSEESRQADHVLRRVQWAYTLLTESTPSTEKRFRSLEID
jgi:DnaJ-domain-containing protein 1